ncbi:uncharacterized protein GJ701_016605 isoform 1-T4 [Geothlypis trichas]
MVTQQCPPCWWHRAVRGSDTLQGGGAVHRDRGRLEKGADRSLKNGKEPSAAAGNGQHAWERPVGTGLSGKALGLLLDPDLDISQRHVPVDTAVTRPVVSGLHHEKRCRQGRGGDAAPWHRGGHTGSAGPSTGLPRTRQTWTQWTESSEWSPRPWRDQSSSSWRRKGSGDLTNVHKLLQGGCKEDGSRLFPGVPSDSTRGDGRIMKHRRLPLNIRNLLFPVRVTEHGHRLPRKVVVSPSLEILKSCVRVILNYQLLVALLEQWLDHMTARSPCQPQPFSHPVNFTSYFVRFSYSSNVPGQRTEGIYSVFFCGGVFFNFSAPPTYPAGNEIWKREC